LQAAIAAVHSDAAAAADTDWPQIVHLYDQLMAMTPTPIVALNRAIAIAEVEGPDAGLAIVETLDLETYHIYHATRGDFLARLGRSNEAAVAFAVAEGLTSNDAETDFLRRRREELMTGE
jgi:RNA polymerase sigma-70 factor (ECF subfamily)